MNIQQGCEVQDAVTERTRFLSLTKEYSLLAGRRKHFLKDAVKAISKEAYSIPTAPVVFNFGGHKTI